MSCMACYLDSVCWPGCNLTADENHAMMLARGPLPHRLILVTFCTVTVCYCFLTMVHNFSTDDALLRSHFGAFGIESPAQDNASLPTLELIPRIIHQTYKSNKIPAAWQPPPSVLLGQKPRGQLDTHPLDGRNSPRLHPGLVPLVPPNV